MQSLRPFLTEKTLAQSKAGRYTFKVPLRTSAGQAKRGIETFFGVKVKNVWSLRRGGEKKRSRNRQRFLSPEKVMVVTLKEGKLDFFESPSTTETKVKVDKGKVSKK